VNVLIDLTDSVGDYIFSAYRTFVLIPAIVNTFTEFLYGPCLDNQIFLGNNKKFISVLNELISQKEMGNYSPLHKECKSRLVFMHRISQVLLAIVDIKDEEQATKAHAVILTEINIQNLINKCVEIYMSKIGGTPELFHTYNYNRRCDHVGKRGYSCVADEFCQEGYMIQQDVLTIEAGFNFYQILMILSRTHPDDEQLHNFIRDENQYIYLL
jgi:hypothetical protein